MSIKLKIEEKLSQALSPASLSVVDDSARHAGHAGAGEGGESHFKVKIVSPHFTGISRVARHKLVYRILAEELAAEVHALNIVARTPEEELSTS